MSDEAMIKEGQSPGKYSKTVPALLAAAAPPRRHNLCLK